MDTNNTSPPHTGFFASTLQKTKQNLTKFSNKAFNQYRDKDYNVSMSKTGSNSAHNISNIFSSTSSFGSMNHSIKEGKLFNSATNLAADNLDDTLTKASVGSCDDSVFINEVNSDLLV